MVSLKEIVTDKIAYFLYYQDGNLWYGVGESLISSNRIFQFPVPISDCGSAKFQATEKAIFFMRWIRKHLESLEKKDNG